MFFLDIQGQPEASSGYGGDPQPTSSNNSFFTPQTAFYDRAASGMEFLSNNPLLKNVVEQGVKDIAGKTMNILPNQVNIRIFLIYFFYSQSI